MAGPDTMPPKARAALIGALLLALGFASGAFLFAPAAVGEVEVHVAGAMQVSLWCGGDTLHASEAAPQRVVTIPARPECLVMARMAPERVLDGPLVVGPPGAYHCVPSDDHLICGRRP